MGSLLLLDGICYWMVIDELVMFVVWRFFGVDGVFDKIELIKVCKF